MSDQIPKTKQDPQETKPKPKLKSIKPTEVEESPLEKLKRLENGKLKFHKITFDTHSLGSSGHRFFRMKIAVLKRPFIYPS